MLELDSQLLVQLVEGLADDRADSVGGGREGHPVAEETAETGSPLAIEPDKTSVLADGKVIFILVDVAGEEQLFIEEGGDDVVDGEGQSAGWVRCGGGGVVAVGDGVPVAMRGADGGAAAAVGGAALRVRCADGPGAAGTAASGVGGAAAAGLLDGRWRGRGSLGVHFGVHSGVVGWVRRVIGAVSGEVQVRCFVVLYHTLPLCQGIGGRDQGLIILIKYLLSQLSTHSEIA